MSWGRFVCKRVFFDIVLVHYSKKSGIFFLFELLNDNEAVYTSTSKNKGKNHYFHSFLWFFFYKNIVLAVQVL